MLDKKTFAIGILSLSAVILLAINIVMPRSADATYSNTQDNDFSMLTGSVVGGGDALYITDKRSGKMLVMVYNPTRKELSLADSATIQTIFGKAGTGKKLR